MAKKNKKDKEAKKARAEEKNKKAQVKADNKSKKLAKKLNLDDDEDDQDIDEILAQFKQQQQEFEEVHIESVSRPSKRINSSMIANPTHGKRELFIFGGETTVNSNSQFFNELFIYSLDSDQWRKITSQNSPTNRSSAAIGAHPSGIILLHGGEFSSPKQNTFYHYSDTWLLDSQTKEWDKIDSKIGPSSRSGHRITVWKNFFILYGGFRDLGASTSYLNDLWVFDITTHKWKQIEFPPNHPIPDARSGHSFLPHAEGAVLWGGYCKVKAGKGLQKGKILSDCWLLKMKNDLSSIRWERRKKQGFQPSPRVGCSMVHHKGRGVLFGGVYDYEETEESLDSVFYNDLFTYQIEMNRWYSLSLRAAKKKQQKVVKKQRDEDLEEILNALLAKANLQDEEGDDDDNEIENELKKFDEGDDEDHEKTEYQIINSLPHSRFNASTAVVDDTLFIFGGIWELGERDFSIDSLYSVDLSKLDGLKIYWEDLKEIERATEDDDEDFDDEEEDEEDEEDDEEEPHDQKLVAEEEDEEEEEIEDEPEIPDERPWLPHPKAFENLRAFYIRTGAQFLEWAISNKRDARGKHLKKHAFDLCQDRWWERREQVRIEEDKLEELGGIDEVIEKDTTKQVGKRR